MEKLDIVALAEFDLVAATLGMELGETSVVTRIVYALVGLSGIWVAARAASLLGLSSRGGRVAASAYR
ncbi:MAG TPA: DUF378 domain-containing protein [Marmoricola sp.]|nr:DUF378 domain-containing protein [Marmoricola sp.]